MRNGIIAFVVDTNRHGLRISVSKQYSAVRDIRQAFHR